jgi:hypothetical protein
MLAAVLHYLLIYYSKKDDSDGDNRGNRRDAHAYILFSMITSEEMATEAREALSLPLNKVYVASKENKVFRGFFGAPMDVVAEDWN